MGIPSTTFISRADVCEWIGITPYNLEKVVKAGKLHAIALPGHKYRKYLTKEVMRVFMKGVRYEDMGEPR